MNSPSSSDLTRRDFLKNTGRLATVSALAGVVLPHVHAAGSDMIQVALVGCGGRGTGAAGQALSTTSGPIKLVAMADVFPAKLKSSLERLTKPNPQQAARIDVPADRQFIAIVVTMIWIAILTGFGIDMVAKAAKGRLDYPLIVHFHAVTYGGWLVLMTAQVWLVRTHHVAVHRRLGMLLWVLLPLMVILGPATAFAIKAAKPVLTDGALGFTAVQLGNVLGASVLLAAGYFQRADAAAHKRLMLMGTIALTEPWAERRFIICFRDAQALSPAARMKLASIAWPCSVAMLSGWN